MLLVIIISIFYYDRPFITNRSIHTIFLHLPLIDVIINQLFFFFVLSMTNNLYIDTCYQLLFIIDIIFLCLLAAIIFTN